MTLVGGGAQEELLLLRPQLLHELHGVEELRLVLAGHRFGDGVGQPLPVAEGPALGELNEEVLDEGDLARLGACNGGAGAHVAGDDTLIVAGFSEGVTAHHLHGDGTGIKIKRLCSLSCSCQDEGPTPRLHSNLPII